jgi:hypothetical protein
MRLPEHIYRYAAIGRVEPEPEWPFPTRWHRGEMLLYTFAPAMDVECGLGNMRLQRTEQIKTATFLAESTARRRDHHNIVTELLSDGWVRFAFSQGLKKYEMANKRDAFYFDRDSLTNPNVSFMAIDGTKSRRGLMGFKTRKKAGTLRHWHFAVSSKPAVYPQPVLQIRAHVLFSDDGRTIWSSADAMHRARRSQCKDWWNDDWRDRILATMAWLSRGEPNLELSLAATTVNAYVDSRPLEFISPVTLLEPALAASEPETEEYLDEEDESLDGDVENAEGAQ